jgi:hypothetical protein
VRRTQPIRPRGAASGSHSVTDTPTQPPDLAEDQRTDPACAAKAPKRPRSVGRLELAVLAIIGLGVALRVQLYAFNPSLTVDEASLALNVMSRSFSGLTDRLDFNQAAPVGFLLSQKLILEAAGATSYALRAVPLAAGIAACLLFYPVGASLVGKRPAVYALLLFAVSQPLILYAATNKQYSVDVAVALSLYGIAGKVRACPSGRRFVLLALAGVLSVLLSHAAAFVLVAVGTVLVLEPTIARRWRPALLALVVVMAWLCTFAVAYSLGKEGIEQIQRSSTHSGGSTLLGTDQPGLLQSYGGIIRSLAGIPSIGHGARTVLALLVIALAVVGFVALVRSRPLTAALLTLPPVIAIVAAALGLYPVFPRTFLFFAPGLILLIAASLTLTVQRRTIRLMLEIALGTVMAVAIYGSVDQLRSPPDTTTAETLRYLTRHARTGDSLYLYLTAEYGFRYYVECGCFGTREDAHRARHFWPIQPAAGFPQFSPPLSSARPRLVAGRTASSKPEDYAGEFQSLLQRKRVWVLVAAANPADEWGLRAFLRKHGARSLQFSMRRGPGSTWVALYDFRGAT